MPISTISPQNNTQQSLLTQSLSATGANLMSALNSAIQKSRDDADIRFGQEQNLINEQQRNIENDRIERFNTQDRSEFLMKFGQDQERESLNNASKALELGAREDALGFEQTERNKEVEAGATDADFQIRRSNQDKRAIKEGVTSVDDAIQKKADLDEAKKLVDTERAEYEERKNDKGNIIDRGISWINSKIDPEGAKNDELVNLAEKQQDALDNGDKVAAAGFGAKIENLKKEREASDRSKVSESDQQDRLELQKARNGNNSTSSSTQSKTSITDRDRITITKARSDAAVTLSSLDKDDPSRAALEKEIGDYDNMLAGNSSIVSNNPLDLLGSNNAATGQRQKATTPTETPAQPSDAPVTPVVEPINQRDRNILNSVIKISKMKNSPIVTRGGIQMGSTDLTGSQIRRAINEEGKTIVAATIGENNKYIEKIQKKKNPTDEDKLVLQAWKAVTVSLTKGLEEYNNEQRTGKSEAVQQAKKDRSSLLKSLIN